MNGTRPILGATLATLAVVSLACSGDDDASTTEPSAATAATTGGTDVASTEPPTVAGSTIEAPATTEASTTTTTSEPEGVVPGLPTLALLTSGSGLGARPLLRWEAVDGAAAYVVSVNAADGGPLWAWEGPAAEVPYGGGPADDPDTTGAQLTQPSTWFVAAKDADGALLAVSAAVDIAP